MFKSLIKIISLLLVIGLNWVGISAIGSTWAYFNDAEISENNLFSAAKLDFSLDFLMSDGFRTQTQGGWGSEAQGDNPGAYRDVNFYLAFPEGLTVGDNTTEYYAHFSTSEAVENFLPAEGTPNSFSESHENPIETEAGILAGQIVALALNVGFDNYDPDFSANEGKLSDFYANAQEGLCENMTVGEVLAEANLILSGQSDEFTPSEINECATEINEKFDNGEMVKITPSEFVWREITIIKNEGLNFQHGIRVEQTSGIVELYQSLIVDAYLNGTLLYSGNLMDFVYASSIFSDSANKWKLDISLPEGAPFSLANKVCGFKYIIYGWQENISIPLGGFSDTEEVSDSVESGEWESNDEIIGLGSIVINEILANPVGLDNALKPYGEWVELYNNKDADIDVAGWVIYDSDDSHELYITAGNTDTGGTIVPAHGFLVVYRNGDSDFTINNSNETIRLYTGYPVLSSVLIDSYSYVTEKPEGFSYARIPDGSDNWVDPIPTPGKTNVTAENLELAGLGIDNIIDIISGADTYIDNVVNNNDDNNSDNNFIDGNSSDISASNGDNSDYINESSADINDTSDKNSSGADDTGGDANTNDIIVDNDGTADDDADDVVAYNINADDIYNTDDVISDDASSSMQENEANSDTADGDESEILQTASLKDEDSGGLSGDNGDGDGNDGGGNSDSDLDNLTDSGDQDDTADDGGETSANDNDMPIKNDDDSTEIIFSI